MKHDESGQRQLQAALEDLDRAFARLAAPLGLPEYPAEIETMLRSASAAGAAIQFLRSLNEPDAARGAMLDLRHSLEGADEETRQALTPVLALEPLVEFSAFAVAIQAGEPINPERFFSLVGAAMPALINLYSGLQDQSGMLRGLLAELDADPVLVSAVETMTGYTERLSEPMQIFQQLQQHFEQAQELVATEVPPTTAVAWASGLHPLTDSLRASNARTEALMPLMGETLRPLFDRPVDEADVLMRCELDRIVHEHVEFLERAREAIDLG
ncbi:hypothetical protein [Streptomyces sp. NPDC086989]|uniref:hypothetical protein n=1 Tax=Streptomyces sp. NPDC086989 TaxID=3365764 RepID=UPI003815A969